MSLTRDAFKSCRRSVLFQFPYQEIREECVKRNLDISRCRFPNDFVNTLLADNRKLFHLKCQSQTANRWTPNVPNHDRNRHRYSFGPDGRSNICRNYSRGHCPYGDKCRYDHVKFELSHFVERRHSYSPISNGNERNPKFHVTNILKRPSNWANAPEFVPKLCYDLCDLCGYNCLHPTDSQQRKIHIKECIVKLENSLELSLVYSNSLEKECGICLERVMEKNVSKERCFGILENCSHVFCVNCIYTWRSNIEFKTEVINACPECRLISDFVLRSNYWVSSTEIKQVLIDNFYGR